MKASNNFLTIDNGELPYTIRSTDNLKDFRYIDESGERAQMTKESAVVGGCYRISKPKECAASQELLIQVEKKKIAEMVLNGKTILEELSNDSNYTRANSRRRRSFKENMFHCNNKCNGNTCLAQA